MSVDTKVRESVDQLETMIEAATASATASENMVKIGRHLDLLTTHNTPETAEAIVSALGQDGLNKWQTVMESAMTMAEAVKGLVSPDVADGKAVADSLAAVMDWLDQDLQDKARETLARWYEVAGKTKSVSRTGEHAAKDLGFEVKVTCQKCREVVGSTKKDNANSLRYQVLTHNADKHGHKPTKGEASWQGITDAITNVFKGSDSQEGGGYTVSKVNGS